MCFSLGHWNVFNVYLKLLLFKDIIGLTIPITNSYFIQKKKKKKKKKKKSLLFKSFVFTNAFVYNLYINMYE